MWEGNNRRERRKKEKRRSCKNGGSCKEEGRCGMEKRRKKYRNVFRATSGMVPSTRRLYISTLGNSVASNKHAIRKYFKFQEKKRFDFNIRFI